jgi:hypothetical protein
MDQKSDRGAGAGMPMQHAIFDRQHRLLPGKRFANDRRKETRSRPVRLAGPHHDARQADADAVEEAAARIVGEQEFDRGLLRAVGSQRRQMKIVADGIRKGCAEHRDRRGEDEPRAIAIAD